MDNPYYSLIEDADGTLLAPVAHKDGDPTDLILEEKLPNLIRGIIFNLLLVGGGIFILMKWDYSDDPMTSPIRYVFFLTPVVFGVYGIFHLLRKSLVPDSRERLEVNERGIFDNELSMPWSKIKDVRIKKQKVKGATQYHLMILHQNDFLESQDISNLSIPQKDEPEIFYHLRGIFDFYLRQERD